MPGVLFVALVSVMGSGSMGLVELLGALRTFEIMPLAGNGNQ